MKAKSLILLVIALGCGSIAAVSATKYLEARPQATEIEMEEIIVALTDIEIGKQFTAENVKLEPWPKDRIPEDAIRTLEDVNEKYALVRIFPGEPIRLAKISDTNASAGEAVPAGYRAISIKVQMDTALSGLLKAGDKVDITVFLRKSQEVPETKTQTILRDVTIFAIDAEMKRSIDGEGKAIQAKTVTLLVKPMQAKKVMLADKLGDLHLMLRREDEVTDDEEDDDVTIADILGEPDDASREPQPAPGNPNAFLDFLKNRVPPEPAPEPVQVAVKKGHTMLIHTPDGITQYKWEDTTLMPEAVELGTGGGTKAPTFTENNGSNAWLNADNRSDDNASDERSGRFIIPEPQPAPRDNQDHNETDNGSHVETDQGDEERIAT